jgi:GTPase SAR1 family protein
MPKASDHSSSSIQKLLYVGDSGTGKTTSLFSLVQAGYKLRIFDFDNLLAPLISVARAKAPELLDNIEFMSFRDEITTTSSGPIVPSPQAFVAGLKALYKWEDDSKPPEWGSDYIAVIDSLTTMSRAAMFWARGMQGASTIAEGVPMKGFDARQAFFTAQQAIMNAIAFLTSPSFNANVIMIAHLKYLEQDGAVKGFPMSVGTANAPEIPTYFASIALATKNSSNSRVIRTRSTQMIDLKNPRSFDRQFADELPMDTGLAQYFERGK